MPRGDRSSPPYRFGGLPGDPAGFLLAPAPDADPVQLTEGDVVFLPHGSGHTLADRPEGLMTAPACGTDDHEPYDAYVSYRATFTCAPTSR